MISPKRPPYQNSTVDAYKTQGQITKMLKDFGAIDTGWADKNGQVILMFTMEAEVKGRKAVLTVQIMPPMFAKERRNWDANQGKYVKSYEANMSQSMRLLYHYLRAKLNAVAGAVQYSGAEKAVNPRSLDDFDDKLLFVTAGATALALIIGLVARWPSPQILVGATFGVLFAIANLSRKIHASGSHTIPQLSQDSKFPDQQTPTNSQ